MRILISDRSLVLQFHFLHSFPYSFPQQMYINPLLVAGGIKVSKMVTSAFLDTPSAGFQNSLSSCPSVATLALQLLHVSARPCQSFMPCSPCLVHVGLLPFLQVPSSSWPQVTGTCCFLNWTVLAPLLTCFTLAHLSVLSLNVISLEGGQS